LSIVITLEVSGTSSFPFSTIARGRVKGRKEGKGTRTRHARETDNLTRSAIVESGTAIPLFSHAVIQSFSHSVIQSFSHSVGQRNSLILELLHRQTAGKVIPIHHCGIGVRLEEIVRHWNTVKTPKTRNTNTKMGPGESIDHEYESFYKKIKTDNVAELHQGE
jgi:hypothetical protein